MKNVSPSFITGFSICMAVPLNISYTPDFILDECSDIKHTVDSNHLDISNISEESFSLGASFDNEEIDIETVSPDVLSITESLIKEKRSEVRKHNKDISNQNRGKLYVIEEVSF